MRSTSGAPLAPRPPAPMDLVCSTSAVKPSSPHSAPSAVDHRVWLPGSTASGLGPIRHHLVQHADILAYPCWGHAAVLGLLGSRARAAASDLALNVLAVFLPAPEIQSSEPTGRDAGGMGRPSGAGWVENWDNSRVSVDADRLHLMFRDQVIAHIPPGGGFVSADSVCRWLRAQGVRVPGWGFLDVGACGGTLG